MYQDEIERQEHRERIEAIIKKAVKNQVKLIIATATCFDCDNPLVVLETEDGISVKSCEKCNGIKTAPNLLAAFYDMDAVVKRFGKLPDILRGR